MHRAPGFCYNKLHLLPPSLQHSPECNRGAGTQECNTSTIPQATFIFLAALWGWYNLRLTDREGKPLEDKAICPNSRKNQEGRSELKFQNLWLQSLSTSHHGTFHPLTSHLVSNQSRDLPGSGRWDDPEWGVASQAGAGAENTFPPGLLVLPLLLVQFRDKKKITAERFFCCLLLLF